MRAGDPAPSSEFVISTDSKATVAAGKVVICQYTLRDADGEVLDSSSADDPFFYLHGHGNIVDGLEEEMTGRSVGDSFEVVVPPEKGYGLAEGPGPQPIPRENFPDDVEIEEGMQFVTQSEGKMVPLWVAEVKGDQVYVDTNHPLAGATLHFAIEITGLRDATPPELEHGHPHGLEGTGGHHH